VFVADEIQSGFGRTGAWFACEHEGVVPDIVTTAKSLGGGLPIAAVTGRAELMDAVHPGGLGGTFGGNPLACAAALAAIETMEADGLLARARHIGAVMLGRLQAMVAANPGVGDARGRGAMVAIELVGPDGITPDKAAAARVAAACHAQGVLVLTAGTYGNVVRLLPPLVIPDDLLEEGLAVLELALTAI
jgi:4-aminobutyrate aminotransferase/(S)-3-amino-2-methylpropionate transaminase